MVVERKRIISHIRRQLLCLLNDIILVTKSYVLPVPDSCHFCRFFFFFLHFIIHNICNKLLFITLLLDFSYPSMKIDVIVISDTYALSV